MIFNEYIESFRQVESKLMMVEENKKHLHNIINDMKSKNNRSYKYGMMIHEILQKLSSSPTSPTSK